MERRDDDSADRTSADWPGVGRRPLLKALGAGATLSAGSGVATADGDDGVDAERDQPEGFEVEVLVPHVTFSDDVAAGFGVAYEDGPQEVALAHDASTVVVARGTFEPGGTSGWHVDAGPTLVSVVEGEVELTFEEECVTRSYTAGEAFLATGRRADLVENASDTERALIYVIFLGVPDGEPPSNQVEPPDC